MAKKFPRFDSSEQESIQEEGNVATTDDQTFINKATNVKIKFKKKAPSEKNEIPAENVTTG